MKRLAIIALVALAACSSSKKGGSYKDDGPHSRPPGNLSSVPDAKPRVEPLHKFANRPYEVFGKKYVPLTSLQPFKQKGVASWYGKRFHGQKTASGETYDMYAMTAAHPTLPLPSYARVTNVTTGWSVVVRVNDRGPFLHNRVIDLSYAAAAKIGIAQKGSGEVEVEAIIPVEAATVAAAAPLPPVVSAPIAAAPAASSTPEAAPSVPIARADGGFVVQLGAFASNANAENFLARLAVPIAQVGVEARIRQVSGLFRVFVGPYATRDEAKRTADRLRDALGLESTIAPH